MSICPDDFAGLSLKGQNIFQLTKGLLLEAGGNTYWSNDVKKEGVWSPAHREDDDG